MRVSGALYIEHAGGEFVGEKRIALLKMIEEYGSITRAACAVGISYRSAWEIIETLNNLSPRALVKRVTGGQGGGGAWLTDEGKSLVARYYTMQAEHTRFLSAVDRIFKNDGETYQLLKRINMKLSARNQWHGEVVKLTPGSVNTVVEMDLKGGDKLTAVITRESAETLGLTIGCDVMALAKASSVIVATDIAGAHLSSRNQLSGTISRLNEGAVSCDVTLELAGGSLVGATVTSSAAADLGLKVGMPAWAVIKASSIILGVA